MVGILGRQATGTRQDDIATEHQERVASRVATTMSRLPKYQDLLIDHHIVQSEDDLREFAFALQTGIDRPLAHLLRRLVLATVDNRVADHERGSITARQVAGGTAAAPS